MVATILKQREIAIIGFNSEDSDDPTIPGVQAMNRDTISFILLAPIGSGTQIFFTDRAWNGTTFAVAGGGDGTFTYMAAADLPAGTVVTITTAQLTAAGINLADTGETIYVYQGAINTPTAFLYAADIADENTVFSGNLTGTGLSVASGTATAIDHDNANFGGRFNNQQISVLLDQIANAAQWTQNVNSPMPAFGTGANLFTAPAQQLWIAASGGGNGAIIRINQDGTVSGGALGYAINNFYENSSAADTSTSSTRFWHPTDIVLDTVHDRFFIADSDGTHDRILQGSISAVLNNPGTVPTMTILYSQALNEGTPADPSDDGSIGITGIALDPANGIVYFTANNLVEKVVYNTANQIPVILANLGTDPDTGFPNYANEIAFDAVHGRIFVVSTETFNDFVAVPAGTPGSTESPPGSGNFFAVTTTGYRNAIFRVDNIAPGDTNTSGNTITKLTWTGSYAETNSASHGGGADAQEFQDSLGKIIGIDVNPATGQIYFTTVVINTLQAGNTAGIYLANFDGTGATTLHNDNNNNALNYQYIVYDPASQRYYVTDTEGSAGGGANHVYFDDPGGSTTPADFATVGNVNGLSPLGLDVDNAPTLTGTNLAATITETVGNPSANPTPVTPANNFSGNDIDSAGAPNGDELAGAQVRISVNFQSGAGHADQLLYAGSLASGTNQNGTISIGGDTVTFSYNAATGVMTLTGITTFDNYEAILANVQYRVDGDNPTNYGAAGPRTISYSTFDGLLYSDEVHAIVAVVGVNDAPVNAVGGAATVNEDSSANAITGVSISDVDADPANQDIVVTLGVAHGTITVLVNVAGGIVAGDITGGVNGSATITITATQNQINATLAAVNGLTYTPTGNYNGADALTMVANDNGNTGTGGAASDTDNKVITITAINDAPTVAGDGTEVQAAILEDMPNTNLTAPSVAGVFGGQFSDALDQQQNGGNLTGSVANTLAGIAVVANGSSAGVGQWQYWTGAAWVDIGPASLASAQLINAGALIRFNPALDYNGPAPTLTVRLVDSSGAAFANGDDVNLSAGGASGGTSRYSTGTVTLDQAITAVNDAPVFGGLNGTPTFTEGGAAVVLDGNATVTDADLTLSNYAGATLTLARQSGAAAEDVFGGTGGTGLTLAGGTASINGTSVGTFTQSGGTLTISFSAAATQALVDATLRGITYANSSDTPPASAVIAHAFSDGNGGGAQGSGGVGTATGTVTVTIASVDDPAVAVNDPGNLTDENATLNIAVLSNDSDPDGTPSVAKVNGTTISVGGSVTLASGAKVTLEANGTLTYDPNGAFNTLTSTASGEVGAVNTSAPDSFAYTLAGTGGGTATVSITVNGVVSVQDHLDGDGGTNIITGTGNGDYFDLSQGGNDTVSGLGGDDGFFFGAAFTAADTVDGGAGTNDQIGLKGNYTAGNALVLGPNTITGIEAIVVLPGFSYNITTNDANVAPGGVLNVQATQLAAGQSLTFNGAAEHDGRFMIFGGNGNDTLTGGDGNDGFYFGPGGFNAGDTVNGGPGTNDQLALDGDYTITLGGNLTGIEAIVLLHGPVATPNHFNIIAADSLVASGQTMTIFGLQVETSVIFNGTAELDGAFKIYGGTNADTLTGGGGADWIFGGNGADHLAGGAGSDIFYYDDTAQSTIAAADTILDFATGDKIDVSGIDAMAGGADDAFTYLGAGAFTNTAGELRVVDQGGSNWLVLGDTDGDGVADFQLTFTTSDAHPITSADFTL